MKIPILFKDPDGVYEAVRDAVKKLEKPDGISDGEWEEIQDARVMAVEKKLKKWISYGEYCSVTFDTEAGTATVNSAD